MRNMSVFDSGLKIAETDDGFDFGSFENEWVSVPGNAVRALFDLTPVSNGVRVINRWEGPADTVEAYRADDRIVVTVAGAYHIIVGQEMRDLRKVILGAYTYNPAFDPPEVVVVPELEPADAA